MMSRPHRIDISGISRETQEKLRLYRDLTGLKNPEALDKLLTEALPPLLREREKKLVKVERPPRIDGRVLSE